MPKYKVKFWENITRTLEVEVEASCEEEARDNALEGISHLTDCFILDEVCNENGIDEVGEIK